MKALWVLSPLLGWGGPALVVTQSSQELHSEPGAAGRRADVSVVWFNCPVSGIMVIVVNLFKILFYPGCGGRSSKPAWSK